MRADLTRSALLLSLTVCAVSLDLKTADGCLGSTNNGCYPYDVWSSTSYSSTQYYVFALNSGSYKQVTGQPRSVYTTPASVRCVLGFENIKTNQDYQTLKPPCMFLIPLA